MLSWFNSIHYFHPKDEKSPYTQQQHLLESFRFNWIKWNAPSFKNSVIGLKQIFPKIFPKILYISETMITPSDDHAQKYIYTNEYQRPRNNQSFKKVLRYSLFGKHCKNFGDLGNLAILFKSRVARKSPKIHKNPNTYNFSQIGNF